MFEIHQAHVRINFGSISPIRYEEMRFTMHTRKLNEWKRFYTVAESERDENSARGKKT